MTVPLTMLTLQRTLKLFILLLAMTALITWTQREQAQHKPAEQPRCQVSFPLPNPSRTGARPFEKLLHDFLAQGCYRTWVADSQVRNSGPFLNGASFGTHNAVKVFYSPEVWDWLKHKNREGEIPDGAM